MEDAERTADEFQPIDIELIFMIQKALACSLLSADR
jgi:hypothetical protein